MCMVDLLVSKMGGSINPNSEVFRFLEDAEMVCWLIGYELIVVEMASISGILLGPCFFLRSFSNHSKALTHHLSILAKQNDYVSSIICCHDQTDKCTCPLCMRHLSPSHSLHFAFTIMFSFSLQVGSQKIVLCHLELC